MRAPIRNFCPNRDPLCLQQYANMGKHYDLFNEKHKSLSTTYLSNLYNYNSTENERNLSGSFEETQGYKGTEGQIYSETIKCETDKNQPFWKCEWKSQVKKDGVEIESKSVPLDLNGEPRIPPFIAPFELVPNLKITLGKFFVSGVGAYTFAILAIREGGRWMNQKEATPPEQKGSVCWALGYAGASLALGTYAYFRALDLRA